MKRIALITDKISESKSIKYRDIGEKGGWIFSYGTIPVLANSTERAIVSELETLVKDAEYVIGISSSGNEIAIYANKIERFRAATIGNQGDVDIAIDEFGANVFDISVNCGDVVSIIERILKKVGN